jgi:hemerythrin
MSVSIPILGIPVVDKDHQDTVALIETIKTCHDSELVAYMDKVAKHLAEHFAREEALMDECGFFASHCHKEEHQGVLKEAAQIQQAAISGDLESVRNYLTKLIPEWLVQHANSMDTVTMMTYQTYLKSHKAIAR